MGFSNSWPCCGKVRRSCPYSIRLRILKSDELGAALHAELATNIGDVLLYCALADDEPLRDLAIRGSFDEQAHNVALAAGERR